MQRKDLSETVPLPSWVQIYKNLLVNFLLFFKELWINTNIFHSSLPISALSSFKWHITPLYWHFAKVKLDFLAWLFFLQAISCPEVVAVKNTIYPSVISLACAPRYWVGDQVQSQILPLQVRIMQHKTQSKEVFLCLLDVGFWIFM